MKKYGIAVAIMAVTLMLGAFVLPQFGGEIYLDLDGESRQSQEEMAKKYDLEQQMAEKLQQLSYETVVTIIQGGGGCSVWVYVSSAVENETQAEEIAQTICGFGAEYAAESITISDWEGATWWNLSGNWTKTLISG